MSMTTTALDELRRLYARLHEEQADISAVINGAGKIVDELLRDGIITDAAVFDEINVFQPIDRCSEDDKKRVVSLVEETLEDLIDVCLIQTERMDRTGSVTAKDYFAARNAKREAEA